MKEYAPMINDCYEWFAWMDSRMLLTFDYPSFTERIELDCEIAGLAAILF